MKRERWICVSVGSWCARVKTRDQISRICVNKCQVWMHTCDPVLGARGREAGPWSLLASESSPKGDLQVLWKTLSQKCMVVDIKGKTPDVALWPPFMQAWHSHTQTHLCTHMYKSHTQFVNYIEKDSLYNKWLWQNWRSTGKWWNLSVYHIKKLGPLWFAWIESSCLYN